jgi:4a-hydroxytetrahydrobiopterin dehydratase
MVAEKIGNNARSQMKKNELSSKKCKPCHSGIGALSEEDSKKLHETLQGWTWSAKKLEKKFTFKNFREAMAFVNQVAEIAENEDHHPDISIFYNKVDLALWTHAANGLTENDFIVAAKVDAIISDK